MFWTLNKGLFFPLLLPPFNTGCGLSKCRKQELFFYFPYKLVRIICSYNRSKTEKKVGKKPPKLLATLDTQLPSAIYIYSYIFSRHSISILPWDSAAWCVSYITRWMMINQQPCSIYLSPSPCRVYQTKKAMDGDLCISLF